LLIFIFCVTIKAGMSEKIQERVGRAGEIAASVPRTVAEELHKDVGGVIHAIGTIATDAKKHITAPDQITETFANTENRSLHTLVSKVIRHSRN
jgi:glucose-6-phosphate-specific signal transduction histidine kinase